MLSKIEDIFERNKYDLLDKKEWIDITNLLINEIEIDKYTILKYKENFDSSLIIENVINHVGSHSHSVVYINPNYMNKKVKKAKKIYLITQYPKCISDLWKSNLISTSDFEDKLYYILSFILDNHNMIKSNEIKGWLHLFYNMKKKSINDVLQKLIWEIYSQVFDIVKPIYVDKDILYFTNSDWDTHSNEIINKLNLMSIGLRIKQFNIVAQDERNILEKQII